MGEKRVGGMLPITQQDAGKVLHHAEVARAGDGDGILRSFETIPTTTTTFVKGSDAVPVGFLVCASGENRRGGGGGDVAGGTTSSVNGGNEHGQLMGAQCVRCGARCSALCEHRGPARWRCNFCGEDNACSTSSTSGSNSIGKNDVEHVPLSYRFRVLDTNDNGAGGDSGTGSAVVFLVDTAVDHDEMAMLKKALQRALRAMPDTTWVGIVEARRASVGFYDINPEHFANDGGGGRVNTVSCTMLPIAMEPTFSSTDDDARHSDAHVDTLQPSSVSFRHIVRPLRECRQTVLAVVTSLRCCHRFTRWRDRQTSLGGALQRILNLLPPNIPSKSDPHRAVGPATRVVCCVGGPSTLGIGAHLTDDDSADVFDQTVEDAKLIDSNAELRRLGCRLHAAGMTADVLVGGQRAVNVPGVALMVTQTGGSVLLHDDFGNTFASNLVKLVAASENVGAMSIQVVLSGALRINGWFGPVDHTSQKDRTGVGSLSCVVSSINASSRISSDGPCQRHVGILLDAGRQDASGRGGAVDIQVTVAQKLRGETRGKVFTLRVMMHGNLSRVVKDMYQEVAAVLVAKRAVAQIDTDNIADIDEQLHAVRARVGSTMLDVATATSTNAHHTRPVLAHHLIPLATRLYFLCHGALLGDVLRHQDEKAALWALFLESGTDFCDRVLAPTLLSFPSGMRVYEELPAVSLALCSTAVLMMDCGTHLLIWVGAYVRDDDAAVHAALEHTESLAAARYPTPARVVAREGSSASRYMLARLIPIHQDGTAEQIAQLPVLGGMKPDDLESLQRRLLMTDVPSLYRWLLDEGIAPPSTVGGGGGEEEGGDVNARKRTQGGRERDVTDSRRRDRPISVL